MHACTHKHARALPSAPGTFSQVRKIPPQVLHGDIKHSYVPAQTRNEMFQTAHLSQDHPETDHPSWKIFPSTRSRCHHSSLLIPSAIASQRRIVSRALHKSNEASNNAIRLGQAWAEKEAGGTNTVLTIARCNESHTRMHSLLSCLSVWLAPNLFRRIFTISILTHAPCPSLSLPLFLSARSLVLSHTPTCSLPPPLPHLHLHIHKDMLIRCRNHDSTCSQSVRLQPSPSHSLSCT